MLSQQRASLFQLAHHHDVHSSVSKYLRARVELVGSFTSIMLTKKKMVYAINYAL